MEGLDLPIMFPQCVAYKDKYPKLKLVRKGLVSVVERFAEDSMNKDVWELASEERNKRVINATNELNAQSTPVQPSTIQNLPFSNVGRRQKIVDKTRKDWTKISFLVELVSRTEGRRKMISEGFRRKLLSEAELRSIFQMPQKSSVFESWQYLIERIYDEQNAYCLSYFKYSR